MSENNNIASISKLIGVPKSTLRYWDSEGLVHLQRNLNNNYREYTIPTMFEIIDVMSYRILNMPIKEIRELGKKPPEYISDLLKEKEDEIEEQLRKLQEVKEAIQVRQRHFKLYQLVLKHPYERMECPFDIVLSFDYTSKEHWLLCQKDNTNFAIYFSNSRSELVTGVIKEGNELNLEDRKKVLWDKEKSSCKFVTCIVKSCFENPEDNNLITHVRKLEQQGFHVGTVIGQLLFTAFEEKKFDYYLAWIEVL